MTAHFALAPPVDERAECAVLGAALLASSAADHVLDHVDVDDLTHDGRRRLLAALRLVREEDRQVDPPTVAHALARLGAEDEHAEHIVHAALMQAPSIGNLQRAVEDVVRAATMRRRQAAAVALAAAAGAMDEQAWDEAELRLQQAEGGAALVAWADGQRQGEDLVARIGAADSPRIPTGLHRLDLATRRMRPGQLTIVLGATSHGKSALVDQIAASAAAAGFRVGIALNEMTVEERFERVLSRESGVPLSAIDDAQTGTYRLREVQAKLLNEAANSLAQLPLAWLPASGMTPVELARHSRRRKLDLLVVDGLQGFPRRPGLKTHESLQEDVHALDAHAKRTGCHVLLTAHVNRQRLKADGTWPMPGLGDVADCTGATKRADNVLCVWRRQDTETLDPLEDGYIRMAKWRGAGLQSLPVLFDGARMRFTETDHEGRPLP